MHNEGNGISPEVLPTIFDRLVRGAHNNTKRRSGSIGLGLYIAREIVNAHQGKIDVESSTERGTTFTVQLPRCPPDDKTVSKGDTPA